MPDLPVRWVKLTEVRGHPGNPKLHDLDEMCASIRQHGYVDHGVIDDRTGQLLGGHGRHEALDAMRTAGEVPAEWQCTRPGVHVDSAGDWWVPFSTTRTRSDREAAHLVMALNSGDRSGHDRDRLAEFLNDIRGNDPLALVGTGYDDKSLADLIRDTGPPDLGDGGDAPTDEHEHVYAVVITCRDEAHQSELLERFMGEGLDVRAFL